MSVFYLHQGGETTGPHGRGRLAEMLAAGAITADAMACAPGSEDWMPVEVAVLPAEVPTMAWKPKVRELTVPMKRRHPMLAISGMLGGAVLISAGLVNLGTWGMWGVIAGMFGVGMLLWGLVANHLDHTRR